jgi:hypothetical protein
MQILHQFALPCPRPLLAGEAPHTAAEVAATIGAELIESQELLADSLERINGCTDLTPAAHAVALELQATMSRAVELAALLQLTTR